MITNEQKHELFQEEGVYFNKFLELNTGKEVTKLEDFKFIDEEGTIYPYEQVVELKFNRDKIDEIMKRSRLLITKRGIKDVDDINKDDYDVKRLIEDYRRKFKKVPEGKISAFIQQVKTVHEPHNTLAIFQIIVWSLMRESVISMGKNRVVECRLDIEVPEEYWQGAKVISSDPIDELLDNQLDNVPQPFIDKNDPLEWMIAITSQIMNKYEDFSKTLQEYIKKVYVAMSLLNSTEEFDDIGYFRSRLFDLLS